MISLSDILYNLKPVVEKGTAGEGHRAYIDALTKTVSEGRSPKFHVTQNGELRYSWK